MTVLSYLPKLKRGLGLAFGAHFLHDFSMKMFLIPLSMGKVSMPCTFSFSRYQTKYVINFSFRQLMTSKTLRLNLIIFESNNRQGEKEGRMEIQTFEYLKNEESFLDEIKSIFHSF